MASLKKLSKTQKHLRKRILEESFEANLSHLGSCLSSADLIEAVYLIKQENEPFVLSNGHAAMALYAVLENKGLIEKKHFKRLGVHPDRNTNLSIDVSTGSLGQGLPIALGMAIAEPKKNVYCLISDGECAEGSIWESLRIACDLKLSNLKVLVNLNGWGAYDPINSKNLIKRLRPFCQKLVQINGHNLEQIKKALTSKQTGFTLILGKTEVGQFPFLSNQDAHYYQMNQNDFEEAINTLK